MGAFPGNSSNPTQLFIWNGEIECGSHRTVNDFSELLHSHTFDLHISTHTLRAHTVHPHLLLARTV